MRPRRSPGKTATALALMVLAGNGCRGGGRRSVGDERLADVVETTPETAERLRAAGTVVDTLVKARPVERDLLVKATGRSRRTRAGSADAYPGDRLAAELAAAANVEVAFLRDGALYGESSYGTFPWARALADDEAERPPGPPPPPWSEPRTYELRWQTGYIGRYAVAVHHLPVAGGAPLLIAIAVAE